MTALVSARALSKSFRSGQTRVHAVSEIGLEVRAGETVALMGPSGCGKSTLLRLLGLIERAERGEVLVEDSPVPSGQAARARLRNEFFGYVHQEFAVIDDESAWRNVAIPLDYARPRIHRRDRRARAEAALTRVKLPGVAKVAPRKLSGGQRQRIAIARALVNNPKVILADEPTAALDSVAGRAIVELLTTVAAGGGACLIATHDPAVAARCDRVVTMHDGCLVPA